MNNQKLNRLYSVDIVETLHRVVTVAASDAAEAHRNVNECWKKGEIVLSADDFESVEFTAHEAETADDAAENTAGNSMGIIGSDIAKIIADTAAKVIADYAVGDITDTPVEHITDNTVEYKVDTAEDDNTDTTMDDNTDTIVGSITKSLAEIIAEKIAGKEWTVHV